MTNLEVGGLRYASSITKDAAKSAALLVGGRAHV